MSLTEINAIDENYPVAGIDQSSQGYRDNFANIKTSLLDLDTQLTATIVTVLDDLVDVDTTTSPPVANEVLSYDGAEWAPREIKMVDDVLPQLGGLLDLNGFSIGEGTDAILNFTSVVTPVNLFNISNSSAGQALTLSATGTDVDVDIVLETKNDGVVIIDSTGLGASISTRSGKELFITSSDIITIRSADNSSGNASSVFVRGGSSSGGNGDGGSVFIRPGSKDGTGIDGKINIRDIENNNIATFQKTSSPGTAVNYSIFYNGITGEAPGINSFSSVDTDVGFEIVTQGVGKVSLAGIDYPNTDGTTSGDVMKTDAAGTLSFAAPTDLGEFTVAGLPDPTLNANAYALATDASGGRTVVRSNGTAWKVIAVEGATVTV